MLKKIGSKWDEKRLRQIEFKNKKKNFFRKTKMTRGIKEGRKKRQ